MRRGQKTRQHEDKHQEQPSAQCPLPYLPSLGTSYQKQAPRSMWDDAGALVVGKVAAGSVVAPHPPLHRSRSRFRSHWSGWRHAAAGSPPVTPPSSRFPEACLKQTCRRTFFPLWPSTNKTTTTPTTNSQHHLTTTSPCAVRLPGLEHFVS